MKALVVLVLIVAAGVGGFLWYSRHTTEPKVALQYAFGAPEKQTIVMEIILTDSLLNQEGPDGDTRYNSTWQTWADGHLQLLDGQQAVQFKYLNQTTLSCLSVSRGSRDQGYLQATLKPGRTYTIKFSPVAGKGTPFVGTIAAPNEATDARILNLERPAAK